MNTVERKGKYAFPRTEGAFDWLGINDMEKMYAVFTIQKSFPGAEEIAQLAWGKIPDEEK